MKFVPLGSIADIQLGKMLSPKAKTGGASSFPYLRNQNVQWGRIKISDLAEMDFSDREREKFSLCAGDLLICEGGEPGRCSVWQGQLSNCYYQKALHRVRPYAGVADPEFLSLWIRHQAFTGAFEGENAKTTIAHLPLVRLEQLSVPDLDIDEQRRIAADLKAQLVAVAQAREMVTAQLGDVESLRLAIYRSVEQTMFNTSELVPFGQLVISYRNGFGTRPRAGEAGPIVLRIADVSSGVISIDDPRRGEVSARDAATYELVEGDLLFVRVNGTKSIVGRCCVVDADIPADTIFNDHLIRVRLRERVDPAFARLCVSLPSARLSIEEAASTSAGQLTVNQLILGAIELPLLPMVEQRKVVREVQGQLAAIEQMRQGIAAQLADIRQLPARLLAQAFHPTDEGTSA